MIFIIINILCTIYMFLNCLPTILGAFGMNFPFLLGFIPPIFNMLALIICTLWLAIDGFGEEHIVKTLSLITAALMAIYFGITTLTLLGLLSISMPAFVNSAVNWLYLAGGVFLLLGIFLHHAQ